MNSSVYFFGDLNNSYIQYPRDYSVEIFNNIARMRSLSHSQIIIHRDRDLMYYAYIKNIDKQGYVGLCVLVNNVAFSDFDKLFDVFENAITFLSMSGQVLRINDDGTVVSNAFDLLSDSSILEDLCLSIKNKISRLDKYSFKLPTESYNISKTEVKRFSLSSDEKETILKSSYTYCYTVVYKNGDSEELTSYTNIVKRLNSEKIELAEKNETLLQNIKELEKQKKQTTKVMFLSFSILVCFFLIYSFKSTVDSTVASLNETENILQQEKEKSQVANNELKDLRDRYAETQSKLLIDISAKDKTISSLALLVDSLKDQTELLTNRISKVNKIYNMLKSDYELLKKNYYKQSISSSNKDFSKTYTSSYATKNIINENIRYAFVKHDCNLYVAPSYTSRVILKLNKGWKIEVFYDCTYGEFYKIRYGTYIGYLDKNLFRFY